MVGTAQATSFSFYSGSKQMIHVGKSSIRWERGWMREVLVGKDNGKYHGKFKWGVSVWGSIGGKGQANSIAK